MKKLKEKVKALREKRGWSQEDLARERGLIPPASLVESLRNFSKQGVVTTTALVSILLLIIGVLSIFTGIILHVLVTARG